MTTCCSIFFSLTYFGLRSFGQWRSTSWTSKLVGLACLSLARSRAHAQTIGDPSLSVDFSLGRSNKITGAYTLKEYGQTYTYTHELALLANETTCAGASTIPGLSPNLITTPSGLFLVAPITVTFADLTRPVYRPPANADGTGTLKFCQIITSDIGSVTTNVQTSIFSILVTQTGTFATDTGAVATDPGSIELIFDSGTVAVSLPSVYLDGDGAEETDTSQSLATGEPLVLRIRTPDDASAGMRVLSIDSMTATVSGGMAFDHPTDIVTAGVVEGTYWNAIVSVSCAPTTGCDIVFNLPLADFFTESKLISIGGTALLEFGQVRDLRGGLGGDELKGVFSSVVTTVAAENSSSHSFYGTVALLLTVSMIACTAV